MESELLQALGKDIGSPEASNAIRRFNLTDTQDSPPFRHYQGSRANGLDFLVENGRVIDIQIFVQPAQAYSAFAGALPFGIQAGMSQAQVHELLGEPAKSDEFDSKYEMPEMGARVTISYDDFSRVKYLSIAVPKQRQR